MSDAFRFQSALQERVEHSKYDTTQRLGPRDPEEAALDADEGLGTGLETGPETGEAGDVVLGVSETAERWIPMGQAATAGRHPHRRRRLRWALCVAALMLLPMVVQAIRRSRRAS